MTERNRKQRIVRNVAWLSMAAVVLGLSLLVIWVLPPGLRHMGVGILALPALFGILVLWMFLHGAHRIFGKKSARGMIIALTCVGIFLLLSSIGAAWHPSPLLYEESPSPNIITWTLFMTVSTSSLLLSGLLLILDREEKRGWADWRPWSVASIAAFGLLGLILGLSRFSHPALIALNTIGGAVGGYLVHLSATGTRRGYLMGALGLILVGALAVAYPTRSLSIVTLKFPLIVATALAPFLVAWASSKPRESWRSLKTPLHIAVVFAWAYCITGTVLFGFETWSRDETGLHGHQERRRVHSTAELAAALSARGDPVSERELFGLESEKLSSRLLELSADKSAGLSERLHALSLLGRTIGKRRRMEESLDVVEWRPLLQLLPDQEEALELRISICDAIMDVHYRDLRFKKIMDGYVIDLESTSFLRVSLLAGGEELYYDREASMAPRDTHEAIVKSFHSHFQSMALESSQVTDQGSIVKAIRDPDPNLRLEALRILEASETPPQEFPELVSGLLQDTDPRVRAAAARTAAKLGYISNSESGPR